MEVTVNDLKLKETCSACLGSGETNTMTLCERCYGCGEVPTELGLKILVFVNEQNEARQRFASFAVKKQPGAGQNNVG